MSTAHERGTRITHGRHARVGHERNVLAACEQIQELVDFARARIGIERVERALEDRKVRQQLSCVARVFGCDVPRSLERFERA